MLRTWREHLAAYRGRLALAVVFMAGLAAAEAGFVLTTEWIFAGLEPGRASRFDIPVGDLVMVIGPLLIIALALAQAGFFYLQAITAQGIGVSVLKDLQSRMFGAVLDYDLAQLKGRGDEAGRLGGLVSRFTNDMTVLRDAFRRIPNALRDGVRLIGFISVLLFLDPVLFICVLLIYPLIGIPITVIGRAIRRLSRKVQGQIGDLTGLLTESLSGQEMVKGYTLEDKERTRMDDAFAERRRLLMKLVRLRALNEPTITVIAALSVAFIIAIAAFRIEQELLTGPELVAFLIAMAMLSQPARGLGTLNAVLQEGLAAIERVFGVIDEHPQIKDHPQAEPLPTTRGQALSVSFRDVHFAYEPGASLLQGFSLDVPAGQTVAIVGPSGAGKSTVFGLLPRFYDRLAGEITIDGHDIAALRLSDLRAAISIVSQTPFLFDTTIAENIRLGDPSADDDAVQRAAEAAAADRFISALPDGYASRVGEGGSALSGGERQRIALARAFLKDAPILLLDEATSALDAESERLVEDAMARLSQGRTTLVIAHRLSTIQRADQIAVMEKGRLVELGDHQSLLVNDGLYARLVALQTRQGERA